MANDLTGQNIQDTYKRVLTVGDDGLMYDGTGSLYTPLSASHEIEREISSSHAVNADTASMASNSFYVRGDITASSHISASGTVYGNHIHGSSFFYRTSYRLLDAGGTSRHIITNGGDDLTIAIGNTNMSSGISIIGNLTGSANISASGDISTSGDISFNTLTGTLDGGSF